jgi:tetratricopeptide (TPR) repeat protein
MAEPKRLDSTTSDADPDRQGQAEALLVAGLDRYFSGQYEDAIHVWTRVLFLDRSHARARAYIDRARTALAERQRRSEQMLQESHDLLERGHMDAARSLLSEAVAEVGDDERAAAVRAKLERLERAAAGTNRSRAHVAPPAVIDAWASPRRSRVLLGLGLVAAAVLVAAVVVSPAVRNLVSADNSADAVAVRRGSTAVPILSSADVALVRARTLYGRGRLAEALQVLDRIGAESPARTEADQLRVEIQRLLLASGQERPRQPQEVERR